MTAPTKNKRWKPRDSAYSEWAKSGMIEIYLNEFWYFTQFFPTRKSAEAMSKKIKKILRDG